MTASLRNQPTVVTVAAPAVTNVHTTKELRDHVGQVLPDDDALLHAYERAAIDFVSGVLGRPVLETTRRAWFDCPTNPLIIGEPVTEVTSVKVYGPDDSVTELDASEYSIDESPRARLFLASGVSWPATRNTRAVSVEYTSGWAAPDVPDAVRAAILILVGEQYTRREASSGQRLEAVPYGVHALLQPYVTAIGVA